MYIDKPMAASLADVLEIFRLAREAGVPVWSSSSLRFSSGFQAARRGESFGRVLRCVAWSPMHLEPHHPDLFWYGIHGVETLFTIMGPGCESVERPEHGKVIGRWKDGRIGIFEERNGYGAEIEGTKGSGSGGSYEGYKPLVIEICKFFKTGIVPIDEGETIEIFAFMEAADESKRPKNDLCHRVELLRPGGMLGFSHPDLTVPTLATSGRSFSGGTCQSRRWKSRYRGSRKPSWRSGNPGGFSTEKFGGLWADFG